MGRIDIILPDELEEEFRQEVAKELGMKRGNLSLALQEAVKLWIEKHQKNRSETAKRAWVTRRERQVNEEE
ncbi:MAG: hypothetical protein WC502_03260 [Methanolinea sp.]|jgi:metal-responsive CopG/Arc/MetJ family transcriptional regulator